MTFDPTSVEVTCVTVPKDHCVQVPWEYVNVCGYSDEFCKLPHTYIHILRTYYVHTTYYILHTTYRISDHIVSLRRDKKSMCHRWFLFGMSYYINFQFIRRFQFIPWRVIKGQQWWGKFELKCLLLISIYSIWKFKVTYKNEDFECWYIRTHTKEKTSTISILTFAILLFSHNNT